MKDYKKILEGVVNIINTTEKSDIGFANICTYIGENCPELMEVGDEKVRRAIITTIHLYYGEPLEDEAKEMISWIEKQGEHQKFRDSIQVGDKVTRNKNGILVNLSQLDRVAKQGKKGTNGNEREIPNLEQKPAWSEEDERICQCLIRDQEEALDKVRNSKYGHSEIISDLKEMYHERIVWLKFLKDRYTWKPSEEVILESICEYMDEGYNEATRKAIEWLRENKDKYLYNTGEKGECIPTCSGKMIDEFRAYMEGE